MPRGILTFELPEEEVEFKQASNAGALASVIWSFDQILRQRIKYQDENHLQEIRDKLYDVLNEHGINIDDLC